MIRILFGTFIVLHGLVHLLYFGHSTRYFELQPGMLWPNGAWAFSKILGDQAIRGVANILLILAAVGFAFGGAALILKLGFWRPVLMTTSACSAVIYLLLWDGTFQHLDNQGAIGVLINVAILTVTQLWVKA